MNIVEKLIEATKSGDAHAIWQQTSSYFGFSIRFEDELYLIHRFKDNCTISKMNEEYDFVDIDEFTDSAILNELFDLVMEKNPLWKQMCDEVLKKIDYEEKLPVVGQEIKLRGGRIVYVVINRFEDMGETMFVCRRKEADRYGIYSYCVAGFDVDDGELFEHS